jgi:hypothetical protein
VKVQDLERDLEQEPVPERAQGSERGTAQEQALAQVPEQVLDSVQD